MNVTFPDNANVQIVVLPHGAPPPAIPFSPTAPVLLAAPARKSSRRRDAVFLSVGAVLCALVLAVVRTQHPPTGMVQTARAAGPSSQIELAPLPVPAVRPIPDRAELATAAPSSDPTEAVKRLLDQRPTVTPAPGAPAPSTSGPSAGGGSRNAFGMSD